MSRIATSFAVAALLAVQAAPLAYAQMTGAPFQPQPQTQGNVTYVSGGIADDWQQAMESQKSQYNLHLLFAQQGTGAYFAYVPVKITDASGRAVLNVTSLGPFLYARLKPGTYTVTASHLGQPITQTTQVPASGGVDLNFYWVGGSNY